MSRRIVNQPKPVTVEHLPGDVVLIEGVRYSGHFFREVSIPNNEVLYAIRRDGDWIWLTAIRNMEEAKKFFDEVGQGDPAPTETEIENEL